MSEIVKLASLSDEEKLSFVRNDNTPGRYILAKVLRERPWDTGSIWTLTKLEDGQMAIARVDDSLPSKDEIPSGVCNSNCSCGAMLAQANMGSHKVDYCPKCQPNIAAGLNKTASLQVSDEILETVGSGLPDNLTVTSDYYLGKVIPTINRWIDTGWRDFSVEGMKQRVGIDKKAGLLTDLDESLIIGEYDRLLSYAKQFALSAASNDLFDSKNQPLKDTVTSNKADRVLQSLSNLRPTGMPWDKFVTLYKGLKTSK